MAIQRFMISPLNSGLQTDVKPWLISDDSFAKLENAYEFFGRIRKRFGSRYMNGAIDPLYQQLYSRFGIQISTTDMNGDMPATPVPNAGADASIGQVFGVGTQALGHEIFSVVAAIAPWAMLATGAGAGTFDLTTGIATITGSIPLAPVYWYPALPVMGLPEFQQNAVNDERLFGFDTRFVYEFSNVAGLGFRWNRLGVPTTWSGGDSDFFWAADYRAFAAQNNILFVTNNIPADGIRYFDPVAVAWIPFQPIYSNTPLEVIVTCKVISFFKERLVLMNTVEFDSTVVPPGNVEHPNRIRWSEAGVAQDVNSFNTNTNPGGSFLDIPTTEAIISSRPLKDRLLVFCEASTWELVYTGNSASPFRIQRINNELGVESAFSTVLFDKAVLGVGNEGFHACNGTNVERIDEKIRQLVFEISNRNDGVERVYGIRDYPQELVYWTFPEQTYNPLFPNKVLVYNYRSGSWAINDDSITAFGNFFLPQDVVWQNLQVQWQYANFAWNDAGQQARYKSVIAGNQEGFTFIVDAGRSRNAPVLSITDIDFVTLVNFPRLLIVNHNLLAGDFILLENIQGNNVFDFNDSIFQIVQVIDVNTISISRTDFPGQVYNGGGTVTRVSRIDILTKQFNFFQQDGRNAYISKVDFNVDRTTNGEIMVDYYASTSSLSLVTAGAVTGALIGTSVLETSPYALVPLEVEQDQLWHPVYTQAEGEYIQIRLYFSDAQLFDTDIALSDFELNAMTFYAEPTSSRLQ